jgi:hypothetical protein
MNPIVVAKTVLTICALGLATYPAQAEWQRDDKALAWKNGDETVWRFSFDTQKGKPFFDPVSINGTRLTNFRPEDHPWHYGLWFSWKYINEANYWEEDRASGKAQGATRWTEPQIQTRANGAARIELNLTYTHPSGRVDLTEARLIEVSSVDSQGRYTIDWSSSFIAGKKGAVLDRTPMPGEPKGQVNGGYAGLSVRLAPAPLAMSIVTPEGPITEFESDRARPSASAVAANFSNDNGAVGSIAILADRDNIGEAAPWYVINAENGMRFVCSAILAPSIRKLPANAQWNLKYRIAVQADAWSPASLGHTVDQWQRKGDKGIGTDSRTEQGGRSASY